MNFLAKLGILYDSDVPENQKNTETEINQNLPETPKDRVGMVFQQYSSLPWRTVIDNVALPLEIRGVRRDERESRAIDMIKLVGLEGHEYKYAQYPMLSGGQLQRVALARNLITGDKMMLLDEPHGALDMKTKLEMDHLLVKIWNQIIKDDPTFIMVTHDISEAVYLADYIYIMSSNPGRIDEILHIDLPERTHNIEREKQYVDYVNYLEDKVMLLRR